MAILDAGFDFHQGQVAFNTGYFYGKESIGHGFTLWNRSSNRAESGAIAWKTPVMAGDGGCAISLPIYCHLTAIVSHLAVGGRHLRVGGTVDDFTINQGQDAIHL